MLCATVPPIPPPAKTANGPWSTETIVVIGEAGGASSNSPGMGEERTSNITAGRSVHSNTPQGKELMI